MSLLTRWDPFAELSRFQRDADRTQNPMSPAIDIFEDAESIVLTAEVPGFPADALNVDVEQDVLTLTGERKLEREEKRDHYRRIERTYGKFSRSFVLPKNVDASNIDANLEAGVLTLRLPKKAAAEKHRVEVKSA